MPRPRRDLLATVEKTLTPPDALAPTERIARVTKLEGKNLVTVEFPDKKSGLVELGEAFRSTIFIKRGSYVVVDAGALAERENKLLGEIVNVVRDEKKWRRMGYWPKEFAKRAAYLDDSDEEESTMGKMPPSDSEED